MKTTKEILKLALKNIRLMNSGRKYRFNDGLCYLFSTMCLRSIITIEERDKAKNYIYANRPNNLYLRYYGYRNNYFWKPGLVLPRILYLIKHIIKLSKQDVKTR